MLNVTEILTGEVAERLDGAFEAMFGSTNREVVQQAKDAAATALNNIGTSDALYYNVEHTVHVTIVGVEILGARHLDAKNVSCSDWLKRIVELRGRDGFDERRGCGNVARQRSTP
jgi:hypothetical protein